METKKRYYKCHKCEINYVEKEGELCAVCKKKPIVNYYSTKNFFNGSYRLTVCYNCGTQLDYRINKKCPKCRWMICPNCGACGCK